MNKQRLKTRIVKSLSRRREAAVTLRNLESLGRAHEIRRAVRCLCAEGVLESVGPRRFRLVKNASATRKVPFRLSFSRTWSRPDGVDDDTLIAATLDRPTFEDLTRLCLEFGEKRVRLILDELSRDPAARPEAVKMSRRMLENIQRGFQRASRSAA